MGIGPLEAYVDYQQTPKSISFKKKSKLNALWKNYQLTENGKVSLFSAMERLKLVNSTMLKAINIHHMITKEFVTKIFYLNDSYELFGERMEALFTPLFVDGEQL